MRTGCRCRVSAAAYQAQQTASRPQRQLTRNTRKRQRHQANPHQFFLLRCESIDESRTVCVSPPPTCRKSDGMGLRCNFLSCTFCASAAKTNRAANRKMYRFLVHASPRTTTWRQDGPNRSRAVLVKTMKKGEAECFFCFHTSVSVVGLSITVCVCLDTKPSFSVASTGLAGRISPSLHQTQQHQR
jgi:hypothetical protein